MGDHPPDARGASGEAAFSNSASLGRNGGIPGTGLIGFPRRLILVEPTWAKTQQDAQSEGEDPSSQQHAYRQGQYPGEQQIPQGIHL